MLTLALVSASRRFDVVAIVMALGFVIGIAGHALRSRTMIITGIIVIAMASVYVVYVPGS